MSIKETHLLLLIDARDTFDNTHSYMYDLYTEVSEAIETKEHPNVLGLLHDCLDLLDNTHCYDTQVYKDIQKELK